MRRLLYALGSLLGDAQAISSGSPRKVAARYARKEIYKAAGPRINRWVR